MVLGWLKKKQDPFKGKTPQAILEEFELELAHHEELVFGVGLFFECISLLYSGKDDLIQTYRKQFRNILQQGQQSSESARDLIQKVSRDPLSIESLRDFQFRLFEGHPQPEDMAARCEILADAYRALFRGRPRNQPLKDDDVFALVQSAVERFAALPAEGDVG